MKEEVISFETAKLAKEKGFDWKCLHFYCINSTCNHIDTPYEYSFRVNANFNSEDNFGYGKTWSAPTLAFLQQWLREKHKIDVLPTMSRNSRTYGYRIFCIEDGKTIEYVHIYEKHETYEQALEQGLIEGLNLIKNERTIN